MWAPQLPALTDFDVLALDLPAFGARVGEPWPGLAGAADDVVARIRSNERFHQPVHLVGLSLGGIVALHVLARHPEAIASGLASGAAVLPDRRRRPRDRVAAGPALELPRLLAGAGTRVPPARRLPRPVRGARPLDRPGERPPHARRGLRRRGVPDLSDLSRALLAVAGSKEPAAVRRSLAAIAGVAPHVTTRLAPGMHHVWSIEDVDLFNDMLRTWVIERRTTERLVEPRSTAPIAAAHAASGTQTPTDAPARGRTRGASTTAASAMTTVTAKSAVNAPPAIALDTSAVTASATAAPSDSPIERAALLNPCADTAKRLSTATENRGYMNPIAAPRRASTPRTR